MRPNEAPESIRQWNFTLQRKLYTQQMASGQTTLPDVNSPENAVSRAPSI